MLRKTARVASCVSAIENDLFARFRSGPHDHCKNCKTEAGNICEMKRGKKSLLASDQKILKLNFCPLRIVLARDPMVPAKANIHIAMTEATYSTNPRVTKRTMGSDFLSMPALTWKTLIRSFCRKNLGKVEPEDNKCDGERNGRQIMSRADKAEKHEDKTAQESAASSYWQHPRLP